MPDDGVLLLTYLPMCFRKDYEKTLEFWTGEAIECSKLSALFWKRLEKKNIKRNADGRDLAHEVS